MERSYRKTLIAGAIAALAVAPAWAADMPAAAGSRQDPAQQMGEEHPAARSADSMHSGTTTYATPESKKLYTMTPSQLKGMKVTDASGQKIGKVDKIVSVRGQDWAHAVVDTGSYFGAGGSKEIAISLDQLQWVDKDTLHVNANREELAAGAEYLPERYVEVRPSNQPISEFSAFESQGSRYDRSDMNRENRGQWSGEELQRSDPRQSSD